MVQSVRLTPLENIKGTGRVDSLDSLDIGDIELMPANAEPSVCLVLRFTVKV